jgi:hypothetical protein
VVKNIFKRLFRVYAHIYYSHFQKIGTFHIRQDDVLRACVRARALLNCAGLADNIPHSAACTQ